MGWEKGNESVDPLLNILKFAILSNLSGVFDLEIEVADVTDSMGDTRYCGTEIDISGFVGYVQQEKVGMVVLRCPTQLIRASTRAVVV